MKEQEEMVESGGSSALAPVSPSLLAARSNPEQLPVTSYELQVTTHSTTLSESRYKNPESSFGKYNHTLPELLPTGFVPNGCGLR